MFALPRTERSTPSSVIDLFFFMEPFMGVHHWEKSDPALDCLQLDCRVLRGERPSAERGTVTTS
jgi:hypothetical protein